MEDFAALLEQSGTLQSLRLEPGQKIDVEVVHLGTENIFVQVSPSQEGTIARAEFLDEDGNLTTEVGAKISAFVIRADESVELSTRLADGQADMSMLEAAKDGNIPVDGKVTGHNKGGLEVRVAGARAFCPISQVDIAFVEDLESFVGQTLTFLIREIKEGGRKIVLTRRALLESQRSEQRDEVLKKLSVGDRRDGVVSRIEKFGAFVDIGGVDGLIPISEMSHRRIGKVEEILSAGDRVSVEVLRIEPDPKREGQMRVSLSLKATQDDPIQALAATAPPGTQLQGVVAKTAEFGAFVTLEAGVDGLIHISELTQGRVGSVHEVVKTGDKVTVWVLGIDVGQRRVSLTLNEPSGDAPLAGGQKWRPGMPVTGVVQKVEPFGVFLSLPGGDSALLPTSEADVDGSSALRREYPEGQSVDVAILAIDERGRIRVSKKALEVAQERAQVAEFNRSQGKSSGGGTFGTSLGDLLAKRGKK